MATQSANVRWTYAERVTRSYARSLPALHRVLSRRFPQALWMGNAARREVALTFDDGPHPIDTPALLDVLACQNVRATFFNTGLAYQHNHADARALARDMVAASHQIALHGLSHQPFLHERLRPFVSGLRRLQQWVADATGSALSNFIDVRPPFGLFTNDSLAAMAGAGFRPVMWSSVPFHWHQTFDEAVDQVQRELQPGAIIVLHEGMDAGPNVVALANAVIQRARDAGYTFVTVDDMWRRQREGVCP